MSFRDTIILAMSEEMRHDENVLLMGEDVGIFGGDFGTSVGMLEEFGPERVRDCPISEAAISGAAAGSAMTGLRPIVDMTFMDFSVIAMDAIVNQAAKTRYMFGGKGQVPMTICCLKMLTQTVSSLRLKLRKRKKYLTTPLLMEKLSAFQ